MVKDKMYLKAKGGKSLAAIVWSSWVRIRKGLPDLVDTTEAVECKTHRSQVI